MTKDATANSDTITIAILVIWLGCVENWKSVRIQFLQNWTVQNIDICSDGFPTETACNPQFLLKVTKITLLAFNVRYR